ncbi:MAG: CBS domain-containing protein [Planctomycetota bacterium]
MFAGIDRLKMLKVRDVMSQHVVEVSADVTMFEAADAFSQGDVSSAPVVDDQGQCVGMLSAADFIKRERPHSSDLVSRYMSGALRSVAADELLLHAARMMLTQHIHHLPVLEDGRPIGVISTMDVVSVLINAVDEVEVQQAGWHREGSGH